MMGLRADENWSGMELGTFQGFGDVETSRGNSYSDSLISLFWRFLIHVRIPRWASVVGIRVQAAPDRWRRDFGESFVDTIGEKRYTPGPSTPSATWKCLGRLLFLGA